jgi:hypothetical protein
MSNATFTEAPISICVDNVYAGHGKLRTWSDESVEIVDCGAVFAGDQDKSENVYELIQEAIEEGKDSLKVELSDRDSAVLITWTIAE